MYGVSGQTESPSNLSEINSLLDRFAPDTLAILEVGSGWWPLVAALDQYLAFLEPYYQILQVKEEFGGLRYYTQGHKHTPSCEVVGCWHFRIIDAAVTKSVHICEICGDEGKVYGEGWTQRTRCQKCEHPQPLPLA